MKLAFIGMNDLPRLGADACFARHHDFVGLEFNWWGEFAELTSDAVTAMRAILDDHGVACSALGLWGWNHLSPDPSERATAHEMLGRGIDFAKTIGAKVLITGGGQIPGAGISDNANEFLRVFPPFLDRLAEAGLQPAFYAVHGASFFTCIEAYEAVWDKLPQVGIKFDPANWRHANLDYLDVLRRHADKVAYVHVKEHLYHKGELVSQPPAGMGDIEWGKVLAFLYEADYGGYLSMEPHGDVWGWVSRAEIMRTKMLLLSQKYLGQFLL
jgi:sugar phosphate isomerase/epimerase